MSNHDNRVLGRMGARALTVEETAIVSGSLQVSTQFCTAMNTTNRHPGDGDGCNADHDASI
jgi:hypothetical protein